MWLFTVDGFFSIVQDRRRRGQFWIRARRREHLERLRERCPDPRPFIHETPEADYPFRVLVPRKALSTLMQAWAKALDYANFKAEVEGREGVTHYTDMLHAVWAVVRRSLDPRFAKNWDLAECQMALFPEWDFGSWETEDGNSQDVIEGGSHDGTDKSP